MMARKKNTAHDHPSQRPPSPAPHQPALHPRPPRQSLLLRFMKSCFAAAKRVFNAVDDRLAEHAWYGENGDLKILALLVAVFVFHNIRTHGNFATEKTITLPVRVTIPHSAKTVLDFYVADKDGIGVNEEGQKFSVTTAMAFYELEHKLPKEVRVTFKGPPDTISKLAAKTESHIAVEITHINTNKHPHGTITAEKITQSGVKDLDNIRDLRVVSVEPAFVRFAWDNEIFKYVEKSDFHVPKEGNPFQGSQVEIEKLINENQKIRLRGSQMMFKHMNEAGWTLTTKPVNVSNRTLDFIERVEFDIPDDSGITEVAPSGINVRVRFFKADDGAKSSVSGSDFKIIEHDESPFADGEDEENSSSRTNTVSNPN